jgi:hypothetical protein
VNRKLVEVSAGEQIGHMLGGAAVMICVGGPAATTKVELEKHYRYVRVWAFGKDKVGRNG